MHHHAIPFNTIHYHAKPCNTMQNHAIPCNIMHYHAIPCNTMQYHDIPCNTMHYHALPCNTMQYNAIPCNTLQYYAIPCIINNCWGSVPLPCGQYMAIFIKPPKQSRDYFTFLLYKISLSTAVITQTYNLWRSNPSRSSAQETSSRRPSCRERGSCRSELPPRPPPLGHLALTA